MGRGLEQEPRLAEGVRKREGGMRITEAGREAGAGRRVSGPDGTAMRRWRVIQERGGHLGRALWPAPAWASQP